MVVGARNWTARNIVLPTDRVIPCADLGVSSGATLKVLDDLTRNNQAFPIPAGRLFSRANQLEISRGDVRQGLIDLVQRGQLIASEEVRADRPMSNTVKFWPAGVLVERYNYRGNGKL